MKRVTQYKFSIVFLLALLFGVNGCVVQYVADYDASIKGEIIQIAKKVDIFWGALLDTEPDDRPYEKFKNQYNQIEADIRSLVMKNEIRALNKESTKQAKIALELWEEDRALHKKKDGFTNFEAKRHRKQFSEVFTAMAKGEEAKNMAGTSNAEGEE